MLLAIYLVVLLWILLFKLGVRFSYMESRSVNLIPFHKPPIVRGKADVSESILNVVVFVPLGVYAAILFQRWRPVKKLFFFFFVSLIIESLQFILAVGAFDITDLITNTLGGLFGLLLFAALEKVFNDRIKAQKIVNTIAAIGTALLLLFLVLLIMKRLPIRYQ